MRSPPSTPPLTELVDLRRRTAVVTGAGGGLGAATVLRLVEAGAHVVALDVNRSSLDDLMSMALLADGRVLPLCLDVTEESAVTRAAVETVSWAGSLDIWINNAGVAPRKDFLSLTAEEWDVLQTVNLRSAFIGARTAAEHMVRAGSAGVVVNMSSSTISRVSGNSAHYRASKAGLVALTQSLAVELGKHGVRAITVAPTLVETRMVQELRDAGLGPALDSWARRLPLGRAATADEVARVVLFAVSDLAAFMTGCVLYVDGGECHQ